MTSRKHNSPAYAMLIFPEGAGLHVGGIFLFKGGEAVLSPIGNLFLRTGITCRLTDHGVLHNYVVSLAPCKEHAVFRVIAIIATQKQNRGSRRSAEKTLNAGEG